MKTKFLSLIVICYCMLQVPAYGLPQEEPIREHVQVVSIEVPVRVFYKGKPVDNLTKADFQLFEGNKQQEISSLSIVKNRLKEGSEDTTSRYLVLVFRVSDYNKQFRDGVKYFFDQVVTDDDQLLIFVNDNTLSVDKVGDKAAIYTQLDQLLREKSQITRGTMSTYFQTIEQQIDISRFKMMLRSPHEDPIRFVQEFLKRYLRIWKEYKKKYLIPDMDHFYYFAKHLEGIKKEKWVINFYQLDMFPDIALSGQIRREIKGIIEEYLSSTDATQVSYGRILQGLLNEIDRALNAAEDFPAAEISKLFYKVDAVFHTIMMHSNIGDVSKDIQYRSVSTDIENSFREITKVTGGILASSNNLVESLDTIREKENICYLLTYSHNSPQKIGKIKVETTNRKYDVRYDDNMRADYINEYFEKRKAQAQAQPSEQVQTEETPDIQVRELTFKNKKLTVGVGDFLMKNTDKGMMGSIGVHICLKDSSGKELFNQGKSLGTQKDTVTVSVPFPNITKGDYEIVINAKDFFTGKTAQKTLQTTVKR